MAAPVAVAKNVKAEIMERNDFSNFSEAMEIEFESFKNIREQNGMGAIGMCVQLLGAKNEYKVLDKNGRQQLIEAYEKTNVCCRLCCGEHRPFTFQLDDVVNTERNKSGKKILSVERSFRCCGWAVIPCCAHEVDLHLLVDNETLKPLGSSSQYTRMARARVPWLGGCLMPKYELEDYQGKNIGTINGPFCFVCDCCGADFSIYGQGGSQVGSLSKLRPATMRELGYELRTDADNYHAQFDSEDVPLNLKLATLAAAFLIDFNFFEDSRGLSECRCCDIYCCGYALPCIPACCLSLLPCCTCCRPKKKEED